MNKIVSSINDTAQWVSRTSIPRAQANQSVVFAGDPAELLLPVSLKELGQLQSISGDTWSLTKLKAADRVLVSTLQEGQFPVATNPQVLAPLCKAVTYAHPKGRLRLLHTMKAFKPTVWVTTPCAALDFLARLYMEFNIDPFELGIEHIVLVGEIASPGTHKRLSDEFESIITDLYCDPLFGTALATRVDGVMTCGRPGLIGLASLTENAVLSNAWNASENAEITLHFSDIAALANTTVRTGQIVSPNQGINSFHHTIGDQVLARGRWLSLPLLGKALKLIDGIQAWNLLIQRGEGTLDRITLKMGLNRETLLNNPMWEARIRESIASVTPLAVQIESFLLMPDDPQPIAIVDDQRNHHLGGCKGLQQQGGWQL